MSTLVLEHSDCCGSGRLGETLRDHGHRLDVRRLHRGDPLPPDLDGIDAVVSCGGPQSPLDDSLEWIAGEMDLLRAASDADMPVVGLCLGCQLLARALGGKAGPLEGGIEAGWHEVDLTPAGREDPIFAGIAWRSMQAHWHRFHAVEAPPGGRVLARSARTPIQAWARGLRTYAVQYHAECSPLTVDGWAVAEPEVLREAGITREQLRAQTQRHFPAAERLAERLFESMALLLMPADRRWAGIARELRH